MFSELGKIQGLVGAWRFELQTSCEDPGGHRISALTASGGELQGLSTTPKHTRLNQFKDAADDVMTFTQSHGSTVLAIGMRGTVGFGGQ